MLHHFLFPSFPAPNPIAKKTTSAGTARAIQSETMHRTTPLILGNEKCLTQGLATIARPAFVIAVTGGGCLVQKYQHDFSKLTIIVNS